MINYQNHFFRKLKIINSFCDIYWNDLENIHKFYDIVILIRDFDKDSVIDLQLKKILHDGCNLKESSYHIIKIPDNDVISLSKVVSTYLPKIVIIFGIKPIDLGTSVVFRLNEPNLFYKSIILPTLSIKELETNMAFKRDFWEKGIKPVFINRTYKVGIA